MDRWFIHILVAALFFAVPVSAETVDLETVNRIRLEGLENSQLHDTLAYLTDESGPRLSGSPGLRAAKQWALEKLQDWGLENVQLEAWGEFGLGWSLEHLRIEMLQPYYAPLIAFPLAWTPGTQGQVTGVPMPVQIESEEDFEKYRGSLKGAIVFLGSDRPIEPPTQPDMVRFSDDELQRIAEAPLPRPDVSPQRAIQRQAQREFRRKVMRFLRDEGAEVVVEAGRGRHGTVVVTSGGSHREIEDVPTSIAMAAEHFNRVLRLLRREVPVQLAIEVRARFHEGDRTGYNVIAEIPGWDPLLRSQVVMLGAHIDSWHAGTGATDNAAGVGVVMEAVRILAAIEAAPRRTIRIALWTGEEQGLHGSRGYVGKHFADRRTMELHPGHRNVSAYFNFDNGTGRIRGIYLQGNDAARPIFEAYLHPFRDFGATEVTIRNTGGTDHQAFDEVGIPGFQFIQDPMAYRARTHHTNMDLFDHLSIPDLMQASVVVASFVYHTAMRDDLLPRKPLPRPRRQTGNR